MEENAFAELIGDLYSAALNPPSDERVPDGLSRLLGGGSSLIWTVDPRTAAVAGPMLTNFPVEAIEAYAAHYYRADPWMSRFPLMPQGVPVRGSSLIDDRAPARTAYHSDYARRYGMFHVVGAVLPMAVGKDALFAACAVLRPQRAAVSKMPKQSSVHGSCRTSAAPHSSRASPRAHWLGRRTPPSRLLWISSARQPSCLMAQAELSSRIRPPRRSTPPGGLSLRWRGSDGNFGFEDEAPIRALRLALTDVTRGGAGGIVRPRFGNGEPWLGIVTPLPSGLAALSSGSAAGARLVRCSLGRSGEALLRRRSEAFFGMTPAESEIAASLAGGLSPAEIAEVRGVRLTTVLSLIRRALERAEARTSAVLFASWVRLMRDRLRGLQGAGPRTGA